MAKTLDEAFSIFHSWLTPSSTETASAKKHRASIEASLKSNFEITRFFRSGSFGNGTSIRNFSDVDYFASIPRKYLTQNSFSILVKVRNVLNKRFPKTGVCIRTPGVLVPFGNSPAESTEVIPADFIRKKDKYLIYEIVGGDGGWVQTSPDAHNSYVDTINRKLNRKVKPLIRFIKAWKYFRDVPISSFYLELRVSKYCQDEEAIVYSIDIKNIFQWLLDIELAAIRDPMGISGYIYPCSSDVKLKDALSKLATAYSRANKARDAERRDNIKNAFIWWNLVYNGEFPAYY